MYRPKHEQPRKGLAKYKKSHILIVSILLVMTIGIGSTVAFLMDSTDALVNIFNPSHVSCQVKEEFDGSVKSNVCIENTSDIPAYIRAVYLVNWVDKNGNIVVPPAGYSYDVVLGNESGWVKDGEYYYYSQKVPAHNDGNSDLTGILIQKIVPKYPEGITIANAPYYLQIEILADAIQADGMGANSARDAWAKVGG